MKRNFTIIIEKADGNFSAFSPDLLGCVATGTTEEETVQNMKEAIEFHLEGLKLEKQAIPERRTLVREIQIQVAA
jgi:predicted RNase H-like HicB family nuclease